MKNFPNRQTMKYILFMLPVLFFACTTQTNENSELAPNPKDDSACFIPADSNSFVLDTSSSDYTIKTTLSPVSGKYICGEHLTLENDKVEKICYRDYNLQIKIKSKDGFTIDKQINKNEFKSIITDKTPRIGDGYFMRKVKYLGIKNNEFRFDIIILTELYDTEDDPKAIIKYFISKDNKSRFEDYPQTYYDSLQTERERAK
jgi:hypothetical protein